MKNTKMKKSIAALAMAAVVAVSLLGYGCGSKSASSTAGVSGEFTGTAKGMGGDVTVTLTLTDGKITGCTAEGKDETPGIGTMALEQLPGAIAESGSIAVDGVATATITSDAIKEAAAAALAAAGLNADDYKTEVKADTTKAEDSTIDADIAIVGAGGAGMTAAITAAAEGKSVVILESQPMVGGNSVRATGGMNAGKTVYQDENEFGESAGVEKTLKTAAEKYADNATITALAKTVSEQWAAYQADPKGYFDSVELMELDTMIGGKGINDPALVETLCSNSADAIDWLDEHGITLHNVASFGGASVKRIHRPVDGDGKTVSVGSYMIPLLQEHCDKAGVQTLLNTTATEILTDANGAAVGVKATGSTGETITVNAKAVVLPSGGFLTDRDKDKKPILDVRELGIDFGGLTAVDNFNLMIGRNEIAGLIGPNGAGKTTVFNLLTNVYQPTRGSILIDGMPTAGKKTYQVNRMGVARTFQNIRLFKELSVIDNIKVGLHESMKYNLASSLLRMPNYWKEEKQCTQRALELLDIFHMADLANAQAGSLPYGAQRRLEIMRALATGPKLLLLDEPAAGMNPSETAELTETIRRIRDEFNIAVLLIAHDTSLVMGICDGIAVLNFGRIIAKGTPDEIRDNPQVIEAYLGKKEG